MMMMTGMTRFNNHSCDGEYLKSPLAIFTTKENCTQGKSYSGYQKRVGLSSLLSSICFMVIAFTPSLQAQKHQQCEQASRDER